ncbi:MAG: hypothetical protein P8Q54_03525 [Akkermansiaceae bacterium]|nr:hypothetical protein [Akkermansiaceae bacterium]
MTSSVYLVGNEEPPQEMGVFTFETFLSALMSMMPNPSGQLIEK